MLEIIIGLVLGAVVGVILTNDGVRKRETWQPVPVSQIREKLQKEGSLEKFLSGEIKCPVCHKTVDFDNLWSIYEDEKSQDFLCRKPECFQGYLKMLHEEMLVDS